MIRITPAILQSDKVTFAKLLNEFKIFNSIDIDIQKIPFTKSNSIELNELIEEIVIASKKLSVGLHLMVKNPYEEIIFLLKHNLNNQNLRIYLHQESNIDFLQDFVWPKNWSKCICIKKESELLDIEYYNQFNEIQLMAVEIGMQGGSFDYGVKEKILKLKSLGYNGEISIDGGINLQTAKLISTLPISRVSVGSYLTNAIDKKDAYNKLSKILNENT